LKVNISLQEQRMHETVSFLRNRFLFVIGSRTLGFGCRRYSRLYLATARLSVHFFHTGLCNFIFPVMRIAVHEYVSMSLPVKGLNRL